MDYIKNGQKVIDLEIESLVAMRNRLDDSFAKAVELMIDALEQKRKIVVTGVGKSGHIGSKIAATLTSTGAPAVLMNAVDAVHGDLGVVTQGDVVLLLSYSGETEEVLRILPCLKRMFVKILSITGNANSTLARESDVHIDAFVEKEACPLNLAPTSSTTTMLAVGDALAMTILEARGFQKEDFAKFHPGGTLGKNLLTKVDKIMRPIDHIAVCTEEDTVLVAITRMTEKRCGAAVVAKPDGTLAGIYTHGDFARGFQKNPSIGTTPLKSVMTPKPIVVQVDKLAVEVLNIFERSQIQDLIVLDQARRPVGLVDVMDLTKFNLM